MSGLPENIWYARFYGAECGLARMGLRAVNPARTIIAMHPWLYRIVGYRLTLWYDLQLLKRCDLFTMVGDDWQHSRGARLERLKARKWGIPEMKHTAKEPAWIRNANFDLLAYLQERFKKATRK